MTKYEMAIAIAQAFNLPSNHLIPVNIDTEICQEIDGDVGGSILYTCVCLSLQLTEQPAASTLRPMNSQLNCSRLELLNLSVEPRPFTSAIIDSLWPFTPDKRWRQTVFH